ncbi:MAG: RIP metalloprotease RseP [Desulfomonilaceae bacterium]
MEYILGFVVLLGVLIFVHEFGHFIVAKLLGVRVLKFSLGFSPVMVKRKWGETEYMLSWIPLGGYVKLFGEEPDSEEEISPEDQDKAFTNKPVWARMAIVAAGPVFNFLFAVILLCAGFVAGFPVLASEIGKALPDSPAIKAGFEPGDTVKAIDGRSVWRWDDVRNIIEDSECHPLNFTIERKGKTLDISVTPVLSDQKDIFGELKGRIGIAPSGKKIELGFVASISEGIRFSGYLTKLVLITLVKLVRGEIGMKALSGPITIAQASGESLKAGLFSFIFLMSYISINLAIINLLPIPVLDGGHILFFVIEAVTQRPVTGKFREVAVQLGLLIIVFLIGLVFFNDIYRIVTKGWTLSP